MEVERELKLQKEVAHIQPDYILKESFAEILVPLELN